MSRKAVIDALVERYQEGGHEPLERFRLFEMLRFYGVCADCTHPRHLPNKCTECAHGSVESRCRF